MSRPRLRGSVVGILFGLSAVGAAAAAPTATGVPRFDHVIVLVEENEGYSSTYGPGSPAVYLNRTLRPLATTADQYYATGHASLDNYIALTSGQPNTASTASDCLGQNLYMCAANQQQFASGRNIADQVEAAGLSWKAYMDGTNRPCVHADYAVTAAADTYQGNGATPTNAGAGPDYADRHNPFVEYSDIVGDPARCAAHVVPYAQLARDIARDAVPAYGFITPDTCHDGHDAPCADGRPGGLASADAWLREGGNAMAIVNYVLGHNGLLLITTDEAAASDTGGCCHGGVLGTAGQGGRVGLLAFCTRCAPGRVTHTAYDHASLLRTVEDTFGISEHLNNAASSTAMSDLFGPPPVGSGPGAAPVDPVALPSTSAAGPGWLPPAGVGFLVGGTGVGFAGRRRRGRVRD